MPETGRSQATNLETQKQTEWIEVHRSQVNMCFLRGPLRWLTEQKNPKFFRSFRDTTNLAISYSQIRCIALSVWKLWAGFSVPSIIWVGVELMQITMQRTRPAWPAKTKLRMTLKCSRIVKEIAMMSGIFVEGRGQILLYSCKRQG